MDHDGTSPPGPISVFLADDNLIVREGVRALINARSDLRVVGVAADYDGLVSGADATQPQVLVTDIRMPPTLSREGIDAAREVRKRHPGTGVVVLSQYEDPEYAVSLLAEGSAGYGYLLKDGLGATARKSARATRPGELPAPDPGVLAPPGSTRKMRRSGHDEFHSYPVAEAPVQDPGRVAGR
jgi:DNA-binding NarL/FixJ family response regulator